MFSALKTRKTNEFTLTVYVKSHFKRKYLSVVCGAVIDFECKHDFQSKIE